MGILTSQCCAKNEDLNKSFTNIKRDIKKITSQKEDSPNSNDSSCSPENYYQNLISNPKRVLFSNFIKQRIF